MRLEAGIPIYKLAGQDNYVSVKRIWDDGDEHDYLSHLEIEGMQFRVESYCQHKSKYASPGALWVLQRLGPAHSTHVRGGHNEREDAVLLDGITAVWIVDEPEVYKEHPDYHENWIVRELLGMHTIFLPQTMEEYATKLKVALPDDEPLETPVGKSVRYPMTP